MSELTNGLRTYRPDLDSYVFYSTQLADQVKAWVEGVQKGTVSRALLITGASGLGKTTLGIAACAKLGAAQQDIQEINCGSYRTLDDARELLGTLDMSPAHSDYRVLVLDEVHQMVNNAQQAFLTPLEKLVSSTIVVACTSQPDSLDPAFRRRFFEIRLDTYPDDAILEILANLPGDLKPATMATIVQLAGGNPGRAIALAESNPNSEDKEKQTALIQELLVIENFVAAVCEGSRTGMFLYAKMVKEENRKVFFEKALQYFDGAWQVAYGLTPALAPKELKFVQAQVARLYGKETNVEEQGKKRKQYLGRIYADLVKLSEKPTSHLKAWAMTGLV